jgi:hypothetical protein
MREAATDPWLTWIRKGTSMQSKQRMLVVSVVVAAVVLLGAGGSARAADEWFVLGEGKSKKSP